MRKSAIGFLLLLAVLVFVACSGSTTNTPPDADADSADDLDGEEETAADGEEIDEEADDEIDAADNLDADETAPPASRLGRAADPVIVTGAALAPLFGVAPDRLAAFRYDAETVAWNQIPFQADERHLTDYYDLYNRQETSPGTMVLAYSDPGTLAGADPEAGLDAADELLFMARDAGDRAQGASEPEGVVQGTGIEVHVTDPGELEREAWVYLFQHEGSLRSDAGVSLGEYSFVLIDGTYPDDYGFRSGPNPEDSWFKSALYERHFEDRWIGDVMRIKTEGSSGADILDIHNNQFLPGVCSRSVVTFSEGEGAFVTNKQGPLRSIRSYIGANSGPRTQRTHFFYEGREDILTDLRVHTIGSMYDFFDFSAEAVGMTYLNDLLPEGVTIDGEPDGVGPDMPRWELVRGAPGGLVILQRHYTNLELIINGFYRDEAPATAAPCYGDENSYGLCGSEIPLQSGIPCTDPGQGCDGVLQAVRIVYYERPDVTAEEAAERARFADQPLTVELAAWEK
ncbi:MAG: hypothetical protein C4523_04905 [Myxococcales bacterium]|nr:MAG: hypothetical protein C4523_04905 [Myxococcales bacterium]